MKGLYQKYIITKTSGKPIPPEARFIVLRIDDGQYLDACRAGAAAFAEAAREHNPQLANDIQKLLNKLNKAKMHKETIKEAFLKGQTCLRGMKK